MVIYEAELTSAFSAPLPGQEVSGEHMSLLRPARR